MSKRLKPRAKAALVVLSLTLGFYAVIAFVGLHFIFKWW